MTQNRDPLENAIAERGNGILKEEMLEKSYTSFAEAQRVAATAISTYNHQRPHSSIDLLTPVEAHTKIGTLKNTGKITINNQRRKEVKRE